MTMWLCEIRCATKAAMPPTKARTPTTKTAPKIHSARLPEDDLGVGPA